MLYGSLVRLLLTCRKSNASGERVGPGRNLPVSLFAGPADRLTLRWLEAELQLYEHVVLLFMLCQNVGCCKRFDSRGSKLTGIFIQRCAPCLYADRIRHASRIS